MKLLLLIPLLFTACATGSTAGLTKDQIAARERNNQQWSVFGLGAANAAMNMGVTHLSRDRGLKK